MVVQYIELFSAESFKFPGVLKAIKEERYHLPVVLVGDEVVSAGKKLNEGLIARHIGEQLNGAARPKEGSEECEKPSLEINS